MPLSPRIVICSLVFGLVVGMSPGALATAAEPPATVADTIGELDAAEGLLTLYPDPRQGKLWLRLPAPEAGTDEIARVIFYEGLTTGLGSNPIGLDRGQLGEARLLVIRRLGDRVLFEIPNLAFRADTDRQVERSATRQSFAGTVLWGGRVGALDDDGTALVDIAPFLIRDAHGVVPKLAETEQGQYKLDADRSAIDFSALHAFPDNVEMEAVLTYALANGEPGPLVTDTAPRGDAFTLVQHVSFVRLPDDGYQPRWADPRIGMLSVPYADYAAPLTDRLERRLVIRHRLEKVDPTAERSKVVEPIVYYVDPGVPEPVRSALVEGASWWADAFEAAGFIDAYRVEILPEDAHPLDVRYNVIQWVHRSTRGWSYGGGVIDPRTGEMLKGHVSLGSLRVRQDRLLFEGLLGTDGTGSGAADDPVELALARIRQLSAHEVGHTLGITHNFAASTYAGRASVMDYPAPYVTVGDDGQLDVSRAYDVGIGEWDSHTVRWGYSQFAPGTDVAASLDAIVMEGIDQGYLFLTDEDARPPGASDPRGNLWDNGMLDEGVDAVEALASTLAVRRHALDRFGEHNVAPGTPLTHLHEVLVPVYLHHRYQLEAAAKTLGGMEYHFVLRGDGQTPTRIVDGARQRRALEVMLSLLDPAELDLSDQTLALLTPRPFAVPTNREMFVGGSGPAFDPLGAAAVAVNMVLDGVLQPERLARVSDFHRRDGELPSIPEVLHELFLASFGAGDDDSPRHAALRRVVRTEVVDRLVTLADNPTVRADVRAPLVGALSGLLDHLSAEDSHARLLRRQIEAFLTRPHRAAQPPAPPAPAPPGSPIGQPSASALPTLGGCSGPHFLHDRHR